MSIEILGHGTRKARKEHQCWNCYRPIEKGTEYNYGTFKYDDVYTIKSHKDCQDAASYHFQDYSYYDFCDGYPPLLDHINDGEGQIDIDALRGHFPHVACRLEFHSQKRETAP